MATTLELGKEYEVSGLPDMALLRQTVMTAALYHIWIETRPWAYGEKSGRDQFTVKFTGLGVGIIPGEVNPSLVGWIDEEVIKMKWFQIVCYHDRPSEGRLRLIDDPTNKK